MSNDKPVSPRHRTVARKSTSDVAIAALVATAVKTSRDEAVWFEAQIDLIRKTAVQRGLRVELARDGLITVSESGAGQFVAGSATEGVSMASAWVTIRSQEVRAGSVPNFDLDDDLPF